MLTGCQRPSQAKGEKYQWASGWRWEKPDNPSAFGPLVKELEPAVDLHHLDRTLRARLLFRLVQGYVHSTLRAPLPVRYASNLILATWWSYVERCLSLSPRTSTTIELNILIL